MALNPKVSRAKFLPRLTSHLNGQYSADCWGSPNLLAPLNRPIYMDAACGLANHSPETEALVGNQALPKNFVRFFGRKAESHAAY
jgi:hypothetical protein